MCDNWHTARTHAHTPAESNQIKSKVTNVTSVVFVQIDINERVCVDRNFIEMRANVEFGILNMNNFFTFHMYLFYYTLDRIHTHAHLHTHTKMELHMNIFIYSI